MPVATRFPAATIADIAQVTDAVEPHPLLYMSVKHVQLDFWRYSAFNPCLGIGRHAQIVEVERGAQTKYFLYGAPKIHDHYKLSIFCMDKH